MGTSNVGNKICATCKYWDTDREIGFMHNKPFNVKYKDGYHDCIANKRKTGASNTCPRWALWEKL